MVQLVFDIGASWRRSVTHLHQITSEYAVTSLTTGGQIRPNAFR